VGALTTTQLLRSDMTAAPLAATPHAQKRGVSGLASGVLQDLRQTWKRSLLHDQFTLDG
jgi:hypothetical protein